MFGSLPTMPGPEVERLLGIVRYFPLRFALPVFGRPDIEALSGVVSAFLDSLEDPLPEGSIRPFDLSPFFDRFLFDCFFVTAFQKLAYFCASPGADVDLRRHFWEHCGRYFSRFTVRNVRRDVFTGLEEDSEVLAAMVQALREQRSWSDTDIIQIAVFQLRGFVERHRGEHKGVVFFETIRRLPECFSTRILADFGK